MVHSVRKARNVYHHEKPVGKTSEGCFSTPFGSQGSITYVLVGLAKIIHVRSQSTSKEFVDFACPRLYDAALGQPSYRTTCRTALGQHAMHGVFPIANG